ncbi:hypothetical protein [Streptomyces hydrogenans]|uniref:hypothetical protein n=1 Tax=Streptomyces hydrogenans TaxID=1873719 RepID=UPI003810B257
MPPIPDICPLCESDWGVALVPLLDRPEAVMGCYACNGHDVALRTPYPSRQAWRTALDEFEKPGQVNWWPGEVTDELRDQEGQESLEDAAEEAAEAEAEREREVARRAEEIADERAKRWITNGVIILVILVVASMCARSEGSGNPSGPDCQWAGRAEECW